jgi:hypothetical protein
MLERVLIGASVTMTPKEVDGLAGNGPVRLVTCADGRVIGGIGSVGLVEHVGVTDLVKFIDEVNAKRAELARIAAGQQPENLRSNLYTFTKIGEKEEISQTLSAPIHAPAPIARKVGKRKVKAKKTKRKGRK